MVVSLSVFWIICAALVVVLLIPFVYFHLVKNISYFKYLLFLPVLVFPFGMLSPDIIVVDDCGTYTRNVLLLPTDEYSRGRHTYVVNHSERSLYWTPVEYGTSVSEYEPLYCESGETIQCKSSIDYIFEEAPDTISVKNKKGDIRYQLSCLPTREEQLASYLEYYDRELQDDPDNIESLFYKGNTLEDMGRTEEANEQFRRVTEIYRKDMTPSYFAGAAYGRLEQWKDAIDAYKKYLETEPAELNKSVPYSNMGYCSIWLDDMNNARSFFGKSLEASHNNIYAHLGLAIVAYKEGKPEEMNDRMKTIWVLHPELEHSPDRIGELEMEGSYFTPDEKQLLEQVFAAYK